MCRMRVFTQLVADADRNQTNLLITNDWKLWMIDFTRAFRRKKEIASLDVTRCDRQLLARMQALTRPMIEGEDEALAHRRRDRRAAGASRRHSSREDQPAGRGARRGAGALLGQSLGDDGSVGTVLGSIGRGVSPVRRGLSPAPDFARSRWRMSLARGAHTEAHTGPGSTANAFRLSS